MAFLQSRGIHTEKSEQVLDALQRCYKHNVHFADAYLASSAVHAKLTVVSFDRDFDKFEDVSRTEPK